MSCLYQTYILDYISLTSRNTDKPYVLWTSLEDIYVIWKSFIDDIFTISVQVLGLNHVYILT